MEKSVLQLRASISPLKRKRFCGKLSENFTTLKLPRQWFPSLQINTFSFRMILFRPNVLSTSQVHYWMVPAYIFLFFFRFAPVGRFKSIYLSWIIAWFCHLFNLLNTCMSKNVYISGEVSTSIITHQWNGREKREKDRGKDGNVEMQYWNLSGSADIIKRVNKFIWCINCACKKNEIQRKTGNKNEKI